MSISSPVVSRIMEVLLDCLSDENVEVREMASQMLSGVVRCSQRQSIIRLRVRPCKSRFNQGLSDILWHQDHFVALARKTKLPPRRDPTYAESLRTLHSSILGICALIESFPYSVEPWMPPLTDSAYEVMVLAHGF